MEWNEEEGEEPKNGVGDEAKKEGDDPNCEISGVRCPLSDLLLTPNLPALGFFLNVECPISFLDASLTEDLGSSAMSLSATLKTEAGLSSITPDTVVNSMSFKVVDLFSVFFIKSVNIWNRSSSDILLGVVTGTGSVLAPGVPLSSRGVVNGVNEGSLSVVLNSGLFPLFLKMLFGFGLNLLGKEGLRGLNLFRNSFCRLVLLESTLTSFRSVSSCSSSLSPCTFPNLDSWSSLSVIPSSSSVESSSSGTSVLPTGGLGVVDLLREKISLILSCSFLVLSCGVVSGRLDLTVVDLAIPGTRGTKKLGLRDGLNLDDEADSVVVMAGVTPSCMTVVPLCDTDIPPLVVVSASGSLPGVVLSGGSLGLTVVLT